jgi:hypothetical protein
LRAEGFFCTLDVLYGGLGIGKLSVVFDQNKYIFFSAVNFFLIFGHQNPGSGSNECGSATLARYQTKVDMKKELFSRLSMKFFVTPAFRVGLK